jgi:hypothetical protein
MNKIVGFTIESVSALPYQHIFNAALSHKVYIIDSKDKNLCEIHKNILAALQKDEWKNRKFAVLDNLCYFLDTRRTEQCNLLVNVSNRQQFSFSKYDEQLSKQLFGGSPTDSHL